MGDVEAALARKTDELHQYRHKLEAELFGENPTFSHAFLSETLCANCLKCTGLGSGSGVTTKICVEPC